jgi:hypothetical protein
MWRSQGDGLSEICLCGRAFSQQSAFSNHKRTCQKSKKRLSSALEKAKQLWTGKKRRRLDQDDTTVSLPSSSGLTHAPPLPAQDTIEVRRNLLP